MKNEKQISAAEFHFICRYCKQAGFDFDQTCIVYGLVSLMRLGMEKEKLDELLKAIG